MSSNSDDPEWGEILKRIRNGTDTKEDRMKINQRWLHLEGVELPKPVASNGAVRMELETAVNNKDEPITCVVCKETHNAGVPDNGTVRRPVPTPCGLQRLLQL